MAKWFVFTLFIALDIKHFLMLLNVFPFVYGLVTISFGCISLPKGFLEIKTKTISKKIRLICWTYKTLFMTMNNIQNHSFCDALTTIYIFPWLLVNDESYYDMFFHARISVTLLKDSSQCHFYDKQLIINDASKFQMP